VIAFCAGAAVRAIAFIAANVSIYLAQTGKRVVAVDADPAGGPRINCWARRVRRAGYGELVRGRADDSASW